MVPEKIPRAKETLSFSFNILKGKIRIKLTVN